MPAGRRNGLGGWVTWHCHNWLSSEIILKFPWKRIHLGLQRKLETLFLKVKNTIYSMWKNGQPPQKTTTTTNKQTKTNNNQTTTRKQKELDACDPHMQNTFQMCFLFCWCRWPPIATKMTTTCGRWSLRIVMLALMNLSYFWRMGISSVWSM